MRTLWIYSFLMVHPKPLAFLSPVTGVTVMHLKHRHQGCSGGPGASTPPSPAGGTVGPTAAFLPKLWALCQLLWETLELGGRHQPGWAVVLSGLQPRPLSCCSLCATVALQVSEVHGLPDTFHLGYLGPLTEQIKTFWVSIIPSIHSFSGKN